MVDSKTMTKNASYDCHLLHYLARYGMRHWLFTRRYRSANTLPGKYGLQQTIQRQQQRMLDTVFVPRTTIAEMRLLQSKRTGTDVLTFYLQVSVAVLLPTTSEYALLITLLLTSVNDNECDFIFILK